MSWLSRLLGLASDDRAVARPLWARVVALAREPAWYAEGGAADTVTGRFDMLTLVMATVLLRLERDPELAVPAARLTELFVADMDGQMRQTGVGDLVVGKRIGELMGALGGRLGALREALAAPDRVEALAEVVRRNVTLTEGGDAPAIAARLAALVGTLDGLNAAALLEGRLAP